MGGGAEELEAAERFDGDTLRSLLDAFPFFLTFRQLGLGGGLSASSALSSTSSASRNRGSDVFLALGSNIFVKFKPTLGDSTKSLARSPEAGVARISPVEVRTTPFIAEAGVGLKNFPTGRAAGVVSPGKGLGDLTL